MTEASRVALLGGTYPGRVVLRSGLGLGLVLSNCIVPVMQYSGDLVRPQTY